MKLAEDCFRRNRMFDSPPTEKRHVLGMCHPDRVWSHAGPTLSPSFQSHVICMVFLLRETCDEYSALQCRLHNKVSKNIFGFVCSKYVHYRPY